MEAEGLIELDDGRDAIRDDEVSSIVDVLRDVDDVLPGTERLYFHLHEHPELSGQEVQAAQEVAQRLGAAGFDVVTDIGGHGVAGVLRNGVGPTVGVRGDMDALPVQELTGLPYASKAHGKNDHGELVPVMHACGHDVHTACLVGAAELLAAHTDHWNGTLLIIAQPAEETIQGARAMIADDLYARTVTPDVVIGQHVMPGPAGMLLHRAGTIMAGARTVRVTVFGLGGHGSQPQLTIDPIVIGAAIVGRLQTIVSREVEPYTSVVISVGSFHAGKRANIIPDHAVLEMTVRFTDPKLAAPVLASIERIVRAECVAGRSPRDPVIEVTGTVEPLVTTAAAVQRTQEIHTRLFGPREVTTLPMALTGSEDMGELALPSVDGPSIPTAFWFLGGTGPERWDKLEGTLFERLHGLPSNHSPHFYPDPEPTLRRGVEALASAALASLHARP